MIACAGRELALRERVYVGRVLIKQMSQQDADREILHMQAILDTLRGERSDVPLRDMLACAERELRMRRRLYPRWVGDGRMTSRDAARETWAMQAILDTLRAKAGVPTAVQPALI